MRHKASCSYKTEETTDWLSPLFCVELCWPCYMCSSCCTPPLSPSQDAANALRYITDQKRRHVFHRDSHAHLLVEGLEFKEVENGFGTLKASGYVRGRTLSVNRLMYLPKYGAFQMLQVRIVCLQGCGTLHNQLLVFHNNLLHCNIHCSYPYRLVEPPCVVRS